jgi:hypothetical protein
MSARAVLATLVCAIMLGFGGAARAQSAPAPVGYWLTAGNSEMLLVEASGTCKFAASNGFTVLGKCYWSPTSRGGILTIMNVYNYKPAPIRYSVVWVNQTTITVFGDVFHKKAN